MVMQSANHVFSGLGTQDSGLGEAGTEFRFVIPSVARDLLLHGRARNKNRSIATLGMTGSCISRVTSRSCGLPFGAASLFASTCCLRSPSPESLVPRGRE